MAREQAEAFVRFAVPYIRDEIRQDRCLPAKRALMTSYSGRHPERYAIVNALFRQCSISMQILTSAAQTSGASEAECVEMALSNIGRGRRNYSNVSLERMLELRPDLSVVLNWSIRFCVELGRAGVNPSRTLFETRWSKSIECKESLPCNVPSLFSTGILGMQKFKQVADEARAVAARQASKARAGRGWRMPPTRKGVWR